MFDPFAAADEERPAPPEREAAPAEDLEAFYGDDVRFEYRPPDDDGVAAGSPPAAARWRKSAAGAVLTGIALGLREVFDPERKERTVIEQEAPGEPDEPQRFELHLDPVNPRDSFAIHRPWIDPERPG